MSVGKISDQDGIQALKAGLIAKGVLGAPGATKVEATLETLKAGHNEGVDVRQDVEQRLAAIEAQPPLPFLRPPAAT